jgi:hypothetical protein
MYPAIMDILPSLRNGELLAVLAPHAARDGMSALAAELALRGPLTVLDGGNRFAPYQVARLLRRHTTDIAAASARLTVRRAFTCYQVLAMLEDVRPLRRPYLVLDLLATFHDEQVPDREALRLLELCLGHLERLCAQAPVAVSLSPAPALGRTWLVERACARARLVLEPDPPLAREVQLGLL